MKALARGCVTWLLISLINELALKSCSHESECTSDVQAIFKCNNLQM